MTTEYSSEQKPTESTNTTPATIEETKTGVTVTVTSKRGSGTRDQDTVTVKAQYEHHIANEKSPDTTTTFHHCSLAPS